jgi:hypothetical protein
MTVRQLVCVRVRVCVCMCMRVDASALVIPTECLDVV